MENYKIGKILGDGTFGQVMQAQNMQTGQIVAIKKMKKKIYKWEDCIKLPEIKTLLKLSHPNVVQLLEIIKQNNDLYFVFEYMEQNIYQYLKDKQSLSEIEIRNIIYQTLQGISYMHQQNLFHRDLKPENILEYHGTIKVGDFGLVKDIQFKGVMTDYVSTRWYRAPEVILRSQLYNAPIDIFAIGCIMGELYKNFPLFPGESESDQIIKICQVLGSPTKEEWPDGYKLSQKIGFVFPNIQKKNLKELIPQANDLAIDLIQKMLQYNPMSRPSVMDCLLHPYFQVPFYKEINTQYISEQNKNRYNENKGNHQKNEDKPQIAQQKQNLTTSHYMKNARYQPGYQFNIQG